jgi:hypothetical protein
MMPGTSMVFGNVYASLTRTVNPLACFFARVREQSTADMAADVLGARPRLACNTSRAHYRKHQVPKNLPVNITKEGLTAEQLCQIHRDPIKALPAIIAQIKRGASPSPPRPRLTFDEMQTRMNPTAFYQRKAAEDKEREHWELQQEFERSRVASAPSAPGLDVWTARFLHKNSSLSTTFSALAQELSYIAHGGDTYGEPAPDEILDNLVGILAAEFLVSTFCSHRDLQRRGPGRFCGGCLAFRERDDQKVADFQNSFGTQRRQMINKALRDVCANELAAETFFAICGRQVTHPSNTAEGAEAEETMAETRSRRPSRLLKGCAASARLHGLMPQQVPLSSPTSRRTKKVKRTHEEMDDKINDDEMDDE